jgi:hypothetical protein
MVRKRVRIVNSAYKRHEDKPRKTPNRGQSVPGCLHYICFQEAVRWIVGLGKVLRTLHR